MINKNINNINKNVKNVLKLISIQHPFLMGSNSMRFNYSNDYDLFNPVYVNKKSQFKSKIIKSFKNMIKKLKQNKNVYFIEFIMGVDDDKPIRWTPNEILNDSKTNYKLIHIFDNESVFKIEIVYYNGQLFIPISNVYEIRFENGKGVNRETETRDNIESLKLDFEELKKLALFAED